MFRILIIALFIVASFCHNSIACSITYSASDDVDKLIRDKKFDLKNYDDICSKLKEANAKLVINSASGVLQQRAFSWSVVKVSDMDTNIVSNTARSHIMLDLEADTPTAKNNMFTTAMNGINDLDIDEAIKSLNEEREKVRNKYMKSKK